jgi:hypothetical protein
MSLTKIKKKFWPATTFSDPKKKSEEIVVDHDFLGSEKKSEEIVVDHDFLGFEKNCKIY